MGEIINLRTARKRRARRQAAAGAQENRVRHGLDKASREAERRRRDRQMAELDGKRLDDDDRPA